MPIPLYQCPNSSQVALSAGPISTAGVPAHLSPIWISGPTPKCQKNNVACSEEAKQHLALNANVFVFLLCFLRRHAAASQLSSLLQLFLSFYDSFVGKGQFRHLTLYDNIRYKYAHLIYLFLS